MKIKRSKRKSVRTAMNCSGMVMSIPW